MTSQRVERTWIRTGGYGRFRGQWVKWTDESLSRVDSSVHLIYHDPSDHGSLILIRIIHGHPCYDQLKAVKKGIRWPMWQCHVTVSRAQVYSSLRWRILFEVILSSVIGFQLIAGSRPFFKVKFSLLSAYGKSWITWKRHFLKDHARASPLA